METKVLDIKGKEQGSINLPDNLFAVKPNPTFLHEVITAFLANQRSGTADVKTRAEVSGTGKKPWKQKGTGRARQGSLRAPQFRHGGVAFGPTPHSFRQDLPVAKRRAAVAQSLSAKFAEGNIVVLNNLTFKEAKTKAFADMLNVLAAGRKPLVLADLDNTTRLASRNIAGLTQLAPKDTNAYAVLNSSKVILTKEAVDVLAKTFVKEAK
ncbi:MAG: 50S ribosomal protein L4 [Elusimicrobiaceae bacterium]|nr:50S ribosomal protein L4 [Elusimicrobiaceae bacterium]